MKGAVMAGVVLNVLGLAVGAQYTISWGLETANVILDVEVGDVVTWKWDQVYKAVIYFICLYVIYCSSSCFPFLSHSFLSPFPSF